MAELKDLSKVIAECRDRISRHDPRGEIHIGEALWTRILTAYQSYSANDELHLIGGHTIRIDTPNDKTLFISSQELPQIWGVIPYARAVSDYEQVIDELAVTLGYQTRNSADAKAVFKNLPSATWRDELQPDQVSRILDFVSGRFPDADDRANFLRFLSSKSDGWSGVAKELSRTDWVSSAIPNVGEWLAVGAARRGDLVLALAKDPDIETGIEQAILTAESRAAQSHAEDVSQERVRGGDSVLFYGAPGTGKSHSVDLRIDEGRAFRTVFHPDMQNSDFVGTLKPGLDDDGNVTYAFRPGPFSAAIAYAWSNPREPVFLVIEELNRAMAAAVFGELFQLLDRNADGSGRYEVDFTSPELAHWFERNTRGAAETLKLPSNLWILATMNSADQGVYPLDTAFRRRWTQEYLPIDYSKAPVATITYHTEGATETIAWSKFVETLNNFLVEHLQIGEDRLVGPRFASGTDLAAGELPAKLLIYLWDDLLRHHGRETVFSSGIVTFGQLHQRTKSGHRIFSMELLKMLATVSTVGGDAGAIATAAD